MKKIFLSILLCIVGVLSSWAELGNGTCGTNLTWSLSDEGVLTISGSGNMNGYSSTFENIVARTTAPWGANYKNIKSLVINTGVTSVGNQAFRGCSSLTSITIPSSVTSIGNLAFDGCSDLTSIIISSSVTSIGEYAFRGCDLHSVQVDSENKKYDSRENCNAIILTASNELIQGSSQTVIPSSVTTIRTCAFEDCSSLTSITIPSSVTSIGGYAFSGCSNLTSITIPSSVTSIEKRTFESCFNLKIITIPSSVTSIGEYAFMDCSSLTNLYIDDLASWLKMSFTNSYSYPFYKSDGGYVYLNNKLITDIDIPADLTTVGGYAFNRWKNCIESVKLNSTEIVSPIDLQLGNLPNNGFLVVVPSAKYSDYISSSDWQDYVSRITTPEYLEQITVNASPTSNGSAVLNAVGTANANKVTNIKVKGSINGYDFMAFRNKMPCLRKIDLSEATIIENSYEYYSGCHSEANTMGNNVFNGKYITEIKLPNSLETIKENAFSSCTALKTASIGTGTRTIGSSAFGKCISLKTVTSAANLETIGASAFEGCLSLQAVELGTKVKTISYSAFWNCFVLQDITLPETVETICSSAFRFCSALTNVALTNVSSLGAYAFYGCSSLKKVVLPNSITVIPSYAFLNNKSLEEVQFGANLESIDEYAFKGCEKLSSVTFPGKINRIEASAFSGCTGLTDLQIPASVQYIGSTAFGSCNNIKNIYVEPALPTPIEQATFSDLCYTTATLHYPSQSKDDYYWHTVWGKFINQDWLPSDFKFNFIYLSGDKYLNEGTGNWTGKPEIEIGNEGGLITEGKINQDSEKIEVSSDGTNSGSIISSDNNLKTNELAINISITKDKWYFFCFPYDIDLSKVTFEGDYVWRTYNAKARAATGDGWKNVTGTKLIAGKGYIFRANKTNTLAITITNPTLSVGDTNTALETAESDELSDASWNFVGNPYLSYYGLDDIATSNFTAPITRWTGTTYEAVSPQDDGDVQLHPFEAFFVQKPSANESLPFAADGQATKTQSEAKASAAKARAKANRVKGILTRQLINLTVSADDEMQDKTRIVFNDKKMLCYESECDAVKFHSDDAKAQIYTIDSDKVKYAINERPLDNGVVTLGFSAQAKGTYTIAAARMDRGAVLVDKYENTSIDLSVGSYIFSSKAGTFNDRFEINGQTETTSIASTEADAETVQGEVYNMSGQRIGNTNAHGIYVIKKGKSASKVLKK